MAKIINNVFDATPAVQTGDGGEPPTHGFPLGCLPESVQNAVAALESKFQAPVEICAQSVLASVSVAAQAIADVELPFGSLCPSSLSLITLADSGARKSAIEKAIGGPFFDHQARLREQYREEQRRYEFRLRGYKRDLKDIEDIRNEEAYFEARAALGDEPVAPLKPEMLIGDATLAGLYDSLADGQASQGLLLDEGGRFLGGGGMSSTSRLAMLTALSTLWDGNPVVVNRGNGRSKHIVGKRLTMHLMVQPTIAASLLGDAVAREQGFLPRCLMVQPESRAGTRFYRETSPSDEASIKTFLDDLDHLLSKSIAARERQTLKLDHEALNVWRAFHDQVEAEQQDGMSLAGFRGFASKAAENAARLAAVLSLFSNPESRVIDGQLMSAGVSLMNFYLAEVMRILEYRDPGEVMADAFAEWLRNRWLEPFISVADICHRGIPERTRDRATALRMVDILQRRGVLRQVEGPRRIRGQNRRVVWQIAGGTE